MLMKFHIIVVFFSRKNKEKELYEVETKKKKGTRCFSLFRYLFSRQLFTKVLMDSRGNEPQQKSSGCSSSNQGSTQSLTRSCCITKRLPSRQNKRTKLENQENVGSQEKKKKVKKTNKERKKIKIQKRIYITFHLKYFECFREEKTEYLSEFKIWIQSII